MISFFTPAANDASIGYLAQIFGNVNGVLPQGGDISILGFMFTTFNSVVLALGALVIIYTTIVGVMMTAHEGEFLKQWNSMWTPIKAVVGIATLVPTASGFCGLQIIMMWVILQGIGAADTLWSSAIDYTRYLGSPFAQISATDAGVSQNLEYLFQSVTCDVSARQAFAPPYVTKPQTGGYYCGVTPRDPWCDIPANDMVTMPDVKVETNEALFGPNGACGKITYCNPAWYCDVAASKAPNASPNQSVLGCDACKGQIKQLRLIIGQFRSIAELFVNQVDYNYQNYYNNGYLDSGQRNPSVTPAPWIAEYCKRAQIPDDLCRGPVPTVQSGGNTVSAPGGLPSPLSDLGSAGEDVVNNVYGPYVTGLVGDFIDTATNEYTSQQLLNIQNSISVTSNATAAISKDKFTEADNRGWIFAGAYYYTIVQGAKSQFEAVNVPFEVTLNSPDGSTPANPNVLAKYRNNFEAASTLLALTQGTTAKGISLTAGSGASGGKTKCFKILKKCFPGFSKATKAMNQAMISATKPSDTNPIAQLAAAGYGLLMAAQTIFLIVMVVLLVMGIVAGVAPFVLGTGSTNPLTPAGIFIFMIVLPAFLALMVIMIGIGVTLGVYVPLIPYILFTFGAIGWMMSTIETMVAGPLVALGILMPGRHQDLLGKAEPALMLLFNVFIRPSLMIFGMIAAMLLANVVVKMINAMFTTVMYQIIGMATGTSSKAAAYANVLELLFFFIAYVLLIVSALNKCFEAIHVIPEKVVRWIGGQAESYGEDRALGEMKSGVESGAAQTGRTMEGAATPKKSDFHVKKKGEGQAPDVKPPK